MSNAKTVMSQAANTWAGPTYIEDVFSTYLYTGNATARSITNGIDLAGEGGLVWSKSRSSGVGAGNNYHCLFDTERGSDKYIFSNATNAEVTSSLLLTSFNSDGYSIGTRNANNQSGQTYASWTFRKAPRFFDVVTYTGDGVAGRTISHNLGVTPGCIIVKKTSGADDWSVYHTGIGATKFLSLNTTAAETTNSTRWNNTPPNSTEFTVGASASTNQSGFTYVAYLFAHDPLGPSGDGSDGLIACGSYTGTGAAGNAVDIGFEPQWLLTKRADSTGGWYVVDNMRGFTSYPASSYSSILKPNTSEYENQELGGAYWQQHITPTGFVMDSASGSHNASGGTYIYIAIRRGPMRQPESGTEVFKSTTDTTATTLKSVDVGFPTDFAIQASTEAGGSKRTFSRLAGNSWLTVNTTNAESAGDATFYVEFDQQNTFSTRISDQDNVFYNFRRAPGFFDVVAYTGDGVAGRTVSHNLGVAPEMMIVKRRDASRLWGVYHSYLGNAQSITLNSTGGAFASSLWSSTSPTITDFTVDVNFTVNASGGKYIAYLFATLPGVSKVGSYTGNGTSQTINCGFTSGARFILIKRTDSTGDWYVWDTERGIVAANDPHLSLNTTAAQVTTDDSVDPDNSGFIVNQVAATNINVNAATYIFYAIA